MRNKASAKPGGLHIAEWGDVESGSVESDGGAPLLVLHGFTGSAETWRPLHDAWPGMRLLVPDLPGHGRSLGHEASIPATIDALLAAMDARGVSRFGLLGYSMGGRIALRLALHLARHAPERISALILESTSPGIVDVDARAARVNADQALADRIERDGIDAFVDEWQALPLWASQAGMRDVDRAALRRQRLRNDPHGLAASLRGSGVGVVASVLGDLSSLSMAVLVIAGALDQAYCDHAQAMSDRLPDAKLAIVPGAGHAVHLEQPQAFQETTAGFLAGLHSDGPGPARIH